MRYENIQMVNELGRLVTRNVLFINCDNCQEEVECSRFTNCCSCGADYDMSGELLADRIQWGYETGESAKEILSENYSIY
ncbi:hypothetical protein ACFOU0_05935 [Salinicoccus sesuvii]|uniref:Uncharacterized protein n=1 Tax=Salinicoccus sesuvii TaxID=868281 RepID=A0ABV7N5E9_9STAP